MKDEQTTPLGDTDETSTRTTPLVETEPSVGAGTEPDATAEIPGGGDGYGAVDGDATAPAPTAEATAEGVVSSEGESSDVDDVVTGAGDDAPSDAALEERDPSTTDASDGIAAEASAEPVAPVLTEDGHPVQYGIGPFSLREVVLGGVWLVAFVVSFFPVYTVGVTSVWTAGIDWVLTIGVPTVAVGLLALRRLSPDGIRRVGSLGLDQFASVAFVVSTVVWLGVLWRSFVSLAGEGFSFASWVVWLEFFLMLAGVVLTTFAPFVAPFNEDFRFRREAVAHRVASPARPVASRPSEVPATAADPYASAAGTAADNPYAAQPGAQEGQTVTAPAAHQAFWALAPVERDVVDESGAPIFRIGPTAWALVIEDRGDVFVVRHEDGRIGYLTDVSGVTRG